jgi:hypothetical protein
LGEATNRATELAELQGEGDCTGVTVVASGIEQPASRLVSDGTLLFWTDLMLAMFGDFLPWALAVTANSYKTGLTTHIYLVTSRRWSGCRRVGGIISDNLKAALYRSVEEKGPTGSAQQRKPVE